MMISTAQNINYSFRYTLHYQYAKKLTVPSTILSVPQSYPKALTCPVVSYIKFIILILYLVYKKH